MEERLRRERRRTVSLLALGSIALHLLLALLAALWIVNRPKAVARVETRPLPVFALAPARPPGSKGGGAAAPASALAAPTLPALTLPLPTIRLAGIEPAPPPTIPAPASAPAKTAPAATATAPTAAAGSGTTTGTGGNGFALFGVGEGDGARRIVIALDLSDSMFVRQAGAFERMAAETARALDGLGDGVSFDLVVFEDGSLAWKPELVPATATNRAEARAWLERIAERGRRFTVRSAGEGTVLFEGGGSRGDTMLRQAFGLRPDLLIVLTDGQWDINPRDGAERPIGAPELAALTAELEKPLADPARIDVFCLQTAKSRPGELAAARTLAEGNGGRFTALAGNDLVR
jgi:hypothetical protein